MPPRRKRVETEEELEQKWKDELPMAIWRVQGQNSAAHFTARKGKVVNAETPIDKVVLGLTLMPALEACWDRGWKTTILPPEDKP